MSVTTKNASPRIAAAPGWKNAIRVLQTDGLLARTATNKTLSVRDFRLTFPADAEIVGLQVDIKCKASADGMTCRIKLGADASNFWINSDTGLSRSLSIKSWGSSSTFPDNISFTSTQLSSSDFKIRFRKIGTGIVYVDSISVKVFYRETGLETLLIHSVTYPGASAITDNAGVLWGTKAYSGGSTDGIFKINKNGTGYKLLSPVGLYSRPPTGGISIVDDLRGGTYYPFVYGTSPNSIYGMDISDPSAPPGLHVMKPFVNIVNGHTNPTVTAWQEGGVTKFIGYLSTTVQNGVGANIGALFTMTRLDDIDTVSFAIVKTWSSETERYPRSPDGLTLLKTTVDDVLVVTKAYGVCTLGGDHARGVVFSINPDGSDYTIIKHLPGSSGGSWGSSWAEGQCLMSPAISDGILYLVTTRAIVSMELDGNNYNELYVFNPATDGVSAGTSTPTIFNGHIYGTCYGGYFNGGLGEDPAGTVWKVAIDGSDFTVLKRLDATTGRNPTGRLVVDDEYVYVTTMSGFSTDTGGRLFRIFNT